MQKLDGIIFVIDATDKIRFAIAAQELAKILQHNLIAKDTAIPLLIFANKTDLKKACSPQEVVERMKLA